MRKSIDWKPECAVLNCGASPNRYIREIPQYSEGSLKMNRTALVNIVSLLLLVSFSIGALEGQPPDNKGKPSQSNKEKTSQQGDKEGKSDQSGGTHDHETVLIAAGIRLAYAEARSHAVDCGLVGQKPIPPGIRKNLARGKPMPPGIAKTRLGSKCAAKFPSVKGYDWVQAGADLILMAVEDDLVSGVLKDVFK